MSRDIQESTPTAAPKIDKSKSKYKRILLKLSGEALMGEHDFASWSVLAYRSVL